MKPWIAAFATCCLALSASAEPRSTEADAVAALLSAAEAARPLPSVSGLVPSLDLDAAYRVQKQFVPSRLGGFTPGGYKAGFTTRAAQDGVGLSAPIAGVLPASGRLEGDVSLSLASFRRLWFETEIAFEVGTAVRSPLPDVSATRAHIRAVRAAVELPDVTLASIDPLEPRDLIAANVLASHYLVGPPRQPDSLTTGLEILVARDGEGVHEAMLRDPEELWAGVHWLLNHIHREGYPIEPGMILLSGSLGPPRAAQRGRHVGEFGALGALRFDVR